VADKVKGPLSFASSCTCVHRANHQKVKEGLLGWFKEGLQKISNTKQKFIGSIVRRGNYSES